MDLPVEAQWSCGRTLDAEDVYANSHLYAQGYEAYFAGLVPAMCPYHDMAREHWAAGWRRARRDDQGPVALRGSADTTARAR